jgi:tetratricopeptide (TPR) repeat protein
MTHTPPIPKVPIKVWQDLYEASIAFRDLHPWTFMDEGQLFAVRDAAGGATGYCCVLGAIGRFRALAVYRGERGLAGYRQMASGAGEGAVESATLQDCLMAEWTERTATEKADRDQIKALGYRFKGEAGWPLFRSYVPHYARWHVNEDEARFLTLCLRAACAAAERVRQGEPLVPQGERLLTFEPAPDGWRTEWKDPPPYQAPRPVPFVAPPERLTALRTAKIRRGGVWEADIFVQATLIGEGERPYYYRSIMLAEQESGFILSTEPVAPDEDAGERLGQTFLNASLEKQRLPQRIELRNAGLAEALAPLADALKIELRRVPRLPALVEARAFLEQMTPVMSGAEPDPELGEERASAAYEPRVTEALLTDIVRAARDEGAETLDELNAIARKMSGPAKIRHAPGNAREAAQDVMYRAFQCADAAERLELAQRALTIDPDCVDARLLLAQEQDLAPSEQLPVLEEAVAAGERQLGSAYFEKEKGRFWGLVETRPYMRARMELAGLLWQLKRPDDAFAHWQAMLELNPGDNQGVRYVLAWAYAEAGRWEALEHLLAEPALADDDTAPCTYPRALLRFTKEGDSPAAREALRQAIASNRYVPDFLLGRAFYPDELPDRSIIGGEDEGALVANDLMLAWRRFPGALDWLARYSAVPQPTRTGRNDPCPCGSGKKFKKCCLA